MEWDRGRDDSVFSFFPFSIFEFGCRALVGIYLRWDGFAFGCSLFTLIFLSSIHIAGVYEGR